MKMLIINQTPAAFAFELEKASSSELSMCVKRSSLNKVKYVISKTINANSAKYTEKKTTNFCIFKTKKHI